MDNSYIIKTVNSYLKDNINFTTCYNRILDFYENQNLFVNTVFMKDFLPSFYLKSITGQLTKTEKQKYFDYFFEKILN